MAFLGGGALLFLTHVLLARFPHAVENLYGRSVGPAIAWALSRVTGVLPFSVAEALILGGGAWVLFLAARGIRDTVRKRRGAGNLLLGGLLFSAGTAGLLVGLFYLLWGFQYSRPPLEERLAWPSGTDAPADVLEDLAVQMIDATNAAYRTLHGTDDLGAPTAAPAPPSEGGGQRFESSRVRHFLYKNQSITRSLFLRDAAYAANPRKQGRSFIFL